MAFICPECGAANLDIVDSLELAPDATWDEIALQLLQCSACGQEMAAAYLESRRGSLGGESWRHIGYRVSSDTLKALKRHLETCQAHESRACDCPAHRQLSRHDQKGNWDWEGLDAASFPLEMAR